MFDFWKSELEEPEIEALIEKAAHEIERRHLTAPAILALEMHKPLSSFGAQASVIFAPFMVPLLGYDFVNDYSRFAKNPHNVERLLQRLESPPKDAQETKDDNT